MAKMFYTMDEVCSKLGKSEDEVRDMVSSGQIQEFRDREKLMFKVEQIDLLAHDEDTGDVHLDLEDSAGASGLALSGSGLPLADSGEGTGVSVFDTDHGGETESGDVGETFQDDELNLDAIGSGSGLLDLTRESDDTSLGAELLEEVYSGEDNIEIPANASGLFEAAAADPAEEHAAAAGIAPMPVVLEAYDGSGSGLGVGAMIGAMAALAVVAIIIVVTTLGGTSALALQISDNLWVWCGALAGATVVLGVIGMFIGKASE